VMQQCRDLAQGELLNIKAAAIALGVAPQQVAAASPEANRCPHRGSRRNTSCTWSDRLAKPFLMSVCPVANHTRTPVGTGIIDAAWSWPAP
jgi:hypothetical protein